MSGFSFIATSFFVGIILGLDITNNGILMTTNYQGRATGEAFVQFASKDHVDKALEKNKESIGHRLVFEVKEQIISCSRFHNNFQRNSFFSANHNMQLGKLVLFEPESLSQNESFALCRKVLVEETRRWSAPGLNGSQSRVSCLGSSRLRGGSANCVQFNYLNECYCAQRQAEPGASRNVLTVFVAGRGHCGHRSPAPSIIMTNAALMHTGSSVSTAATDSENIKSKELATNKD